MKTIAYNGRVIAPGTAPETGYVAAADGIIEKVGTGDPPETPGAEMIDARGGWIAPGLVDIHTHGFGGHWGFFKADELLDMASALPARGVTAFVPTTVSLPHPAVLGAVKAVKSAMASQAENASEAPAGARVLGVNIEGPYINPAKGGAHIPSAIRPAPEKEVEEILSEAGPALLMMTLAPEIAGGMELIDKLVAAGVLPVVGHSDATAAQTHEAARRGATHFTHLFNAVRAFHQREPGCAFAALADPAMTVELILDGKHVHIDAAKIAFALKSADRMALVTDSIHAAGMPDGEYDVWGFKVNVKDGVCAIPNGTMAGSVLTLDVAVKNAVELLGAAPEEAFRMASLTPARIIGRAGALGSLQPGKAADIAVFDEAFNCAATIISGRIVHRAE
ncbi:MAG TPA: N-acetylglucosamine-6-phosphate deacetylase [bacterium]|nr:N-acetylglucosamine-6-phosphate deacetylase [bacterium]